MEEHYKLYHATERENVLKIVEEQKFIVIEDINNERFLGTGAYFYLNKIDAVDWNGRAVTKNNNSNLFPTFIELRNKYGIICATCDVEKKNVLDLDTREAIIAYKKIVGKIKKFVKPVVDYKDRNELATMINYLNKQGLLDGIYIILKTFSYPVKKDLGLNIQKKMACVKNVDILKDYKEIEMTKDEYKEFKLMYE